MVSDDLEQDANRFARLFAKGHVVASPDCYTVETGPNSAPLKLLTQAAIEAQYPNMDLSQSPARVFTGLQIKVTDLEAARQCLTAAGVNAITTKRGLAAPPQDTSGVILEFVPS